MKLPFISSTLLVLSLSCSEENRFGESPPNRFEARLTSHQALVRVGDCYGFFVSADQIISLSSCLEENSKVWNWLNYEWKAQDIFSVEVFDSGISLITTKDEASPFFYAIEKMPTFPLRVAIQKPRTVYECDAEDLFHTCQLEFGSIGSPLINSAGEVVGIHADDNAENCRDNLCRYEHIPSYEFFLTEGY